VVRRGMPEDVYRFGPFVLDLVEWRLEANGDEVVVQSKVLDLLAALLRRPGQLRTRESLHQELWPDAVVSEDALFQLVRKARKALGDDARRPRWIATVQGRGYRFVGRVASGGAASHAREIPEAPTPPTPVPALPTAASTATPASVSPPSRPLIGRTTLLAALRDRLTEPGGITTLHGPAGSGKGAIARAVLSERSSPVCRVDLADARTVTDVCEALSAGLGLDADEGAQPRRLRAALAGTPDLILLLEHPEGCVEALAGELDGALQAAPELRVVVTSRLLLGLDREVPLAVPPLPREEACALFVARAATSGVELTPDDPQVQAIVDSVDRLPLALELAAARVGLLGVDGIVSRLSRPLQLFRGLSPGQRGLRAAISRTWEVLSTDEQALLTATAVLGRSFTVDAAEAVLQPLVDVDVLEGLDRLMSFSLLHRASPGRLATYHGVLELIEAEHPDTVRALRQRAQPLLLQWFATLGDAPGMPWGPQPAARPSLMAELAGALACCDRAPPDQAVAVARILCWVTPLLFQAGQPERATHAIARMRALTDLPVDLQQTVDLRMLAVSRAIGRTVHLSTSEEIARRAADRDEGPLRLAALGTWLMAVGEYGSNQTHEEALDELRQGLTRSAGPAGLEALARSGLGWFLLRLEDAAGAERELQAALGLARLSGDRWLSSIIGRDLAGVYLDLGRISEAEALLELSIQEVAIARTEGWQHRAREMLGMVLGRSGRPKAARAIHTDLLQRYRATGQAGNAARQALRLGILEGLGGSPTRAMAWFEQARAYYASVGSERFITDCHFNLGEAARRAGRYDEARRQFRAAREGYARLGRPSHTALADGSLARIEPDPARAERGVRQAIDRIDGGQPSPLSAELRSVLTVLVAERDPEGARTMSREAVAHFEAGESSPRLVEALARDAEVARITGDLEEARQVCARARRLADELGMEAGCEGRTLIASLREALLASP